MPVGDREKVDRLVRTWDRVMAHNPESAPLNPYEEKIEVEEEAKSTADTNLTTAFVLLSTWGFNPRTAITPQDRGKAQFAKAGEAMAKIAEGHLGHTLNQLYKALEHARAAHNPESQALSEQLRGMILMVYAWGYVIDRTHQLELRDTAIYPSLADFASSAPNTDERARLTQSAENRMEGILGLLLQAIDSAERQHVRSVVLLMTGALMMLYALSNTHFGVGVGLQELSHADSIKLP